MIMPKLIGVSGKKRVGKDTFFDITDKIYKERFTRKKFADKLKHISSIITGLPIDIFYKGDYSMYLPDWGMDIRTLQQKIGTEAFRNNVNPDTWVLALFSDFSSVDAESQWIITDVRFPNEVEYIKKYGGVIIRIENDNLDNSDTHYSETALDNYKDWDFVIKNNGTLDDYEETIRKWWHYYLK